MLGWNLLVGGELALDLFEAFDLVLEEGADLQAGLEVVVCGGRLLLELDFALLSVFKERNHIQIRITWQYYTHCVEIDTLNSNSDFKD